MPEPSKPVPIPKKGSMKAVTKVQKDSNKGKCSLKENHSLYVHKHIADQASHLAPYDRHSTIITSWKTQKAVHLWLSRELAKHAMSEGTKAVTKYTSSK
ncbi:hypothetical protein A6R68_19187 [Neotoma lepida]|uniref:Histone H2A/H2B/H3 domain-containing protein n=1 Tax=Neotoma lepida TaxID=56216 RepID=A0A1A6HKD7_NEOLE|nr:hypothetical protein A6R68_19187 [Neotoma lepida]